MLHDKIIPQEKLAILKQVDASMANLRKEFAICELQKENQILKLLLEFNLPMTATLNYDGSVEIPDQPKPKPKPKPEPESNLEYHNEGAV